MNCQDIKVLGKRELHNLLKYRYKYNRMQNNERKKQKDEIDKSKPVVELGESDMDEINDKELEETIKRVEKERKKQDKKDKEKKQKSDLRQKMSVIASTDLHNQNDDVLFDKRTFERLQGLDIENLDYIDEEEEDDEYANNPDILHKVKADEEEESEIEDDEDAKIKSLDKMAEDIDEFYRQKKDYQMDKDRRMAKREKKQMALLEQQRLKKADLSEEDDLNNDDIREKKVKFAQNVKVDESSDESDEDDSTGHKPLFINPLLLNQKNKKANKTSNDDDE